MATEYIEKQVATMIPVFPKEHRKYQTMNLDDAYENGWYDALECVEKLPPVNVRPVRRGRWIVRETAYGDTEARCSECGFSTLINEPGNGLHMLSDLNYCSGCGSYNGIEITQEQEAKTQDKFEGWSDELKETYRQLLESLGIERGDNDG